MSEEIKQKILYLRDVMKLTFPRDRGEDRDIAKDRLKDISWEISKKRETAAVSLGQILFPDR